MLQHVKRAITSQLTTGQIDKVRSQIDKVRRPLNKIRKPLNKIRRQKLVRAGGAPASWYDQRYSGAVHEYTVHYSSSRYLPVWEAISNRIKPGAHILEIGCGPAQLAHMLIDRAIPASYVGFDFSPAAIELAKKNLPGQRLEVGDARTTDLVNTLDFDVVICTEVLEHIIDDIPVLERIPNGVQVLATVPNFDYKTHVRFFADAVEVRARYGHMFSPLEITEHFFAGDHDGSRGVFFLIDGVRA